MERPRSHLARVSLLALLMPALLLTHSCGGRLKRRTITTISAGQEGSFAVFSAAPGTAHRQVSLQISLAGDWSQATEALIIRRPGTTAPGVEDCSTSPTPPSTLAQTILGESLTEPVTLVDDTNANMKTAFSYRACIMGAGGEVLLSDIVEGVESKDLVAPEASGSGYVFAARRDGGGRHKLFFTQSCFLDSDLATVKIFRITGGIAPPDTCNSGDLVYQGTGSTALTPNGGGTWSYRYCIFDTSNNVVSLTLLSQNATGIVQGDVPLDPCGS